MSLQRPTLVNSTSKSEQIEDRGCYSVLSAHRSVLNIESEADYYIKVSLIYKVVFPHRSPNGNTVNLFTYYIQFSQDFS